MRPDPHPVQMMITTLEAQQPASPALLHRGPYSLDDVSPTCLAKQSSSQILLNRWRELTASDFVIGYSRGTGRVRCSTCLGKITEGELQVRPWSS